MGDCHSTSWKQLLRRRDLTDHVMHWVAACLIISKITLVRWSTNCLIKEKKSPCKTASQQTRDGMGIVVMITQQYNIVSETTIGTLRKDRYETIRLVVSLVLSTVYSYGQCESEEIYEKDHAVLV